MNIKLKTISVVALLLLCSCVKVDDRNVQEQTTNPNVTTSVTVTTVVTDAQKEIEYEEYENEDAKYHTDDSDMINIYDYEFASLPFMKSNIMNNTLYTSPVQEIYALVENDYCEMFAETDIFGYHEYHPCHKVSNEFYEFGDYKSNLLDVMEGELVFSIEESNTIFAKCINYDDKALKDIINKSTKIIELPIHMDLMYDRENLNSIHCYSDNYLYIVAFDDYFIMELFNKENGARSFTYFENTYMNDYIHDMWNVTDNKSCMVNDEE